MGSTVIVCYCSLSCYTILPSSFQLHPLCFLCGSLTNSEGRTKYYAVTVWADLHSTCTAQQGKTKAPQRGNKAAVEKTAGVCCFLSMSHSIFPLALHVIFLLHHTCFKWLYPDQIYAELNAGIGKQTWKELFTNVHFIG